MAQLFVSLENFFIHPKVSELTTQLHISPSYGIPCRHCAQWHWESHNSKLLTGIQLWLHAHMSSCDMMQYALLSSHYTIDLTRWYSVKANPMSSKSTARTVQCHWIIWSQHTRRHQRYWTNSKHKCRPAPGLRRRQTLALISLQTLFTRLYHIPHAQAGTFGGHSTLGTTFRNNFCLSFHWRGSTVATVLFTLYQLLYHPLFTYLPCLLMYMCSLCYSIYHTGSLEWKSLLSALLE